MSECRGFVGNSGEADWRELERARVASGVPIRLLDWECDHSLGDRSKTYNGIGLRKVIGGAANHERRRAFYDLRRRA